MGIQSTHSRYGSVAMTLHWLIALLIVTNIALGFYFNEVMDSHDMARHGVIGIHKSIGLTVLALSLVRLAWRLMNPVPALPADLSGTWKRTAHFTHYLLYFFMIAIPFVGWMLSSTSGMPIPWFGVFNWPVLSFMADLTKDQKHMYAPLLGETHIILAYSALVLALGHISAALYHYFVRRDGVLQRMATGTDIPA